MKIRKYQKGYINLPTLGEIFTVIICLCVVFTLVGLGIGSLYNSMKDPVEAQTSGLNFKVDDEFRVYLFKNCIKNNCIITIEGVEFDVSLNKGD